MKNWARIENEIVCETTNIDPVGRFHPSLVWTKCPAEVQGGWTHNNGTFTAPARHQTTAQDLAPGRNLEGLTAAEIAAFQELADILNSNADSLRVAIEA